MAETKSTLKTPEEIAKELGLQIQQPEQQLSEDSLERSIEEELLKEQQFGDRAGTALATGLLSGATLGLSDAILTDVGAFEPEALKEIRERSPVASGVGEFAGTVGSVFVPGAPLANVSKIAGAGAKQLGKEALKATSAAGIKNKFVKKAIKESAELGLVGAAEGAAIGAGEAVSEAALQNKPLTAEEIVASMGSGALMGGFFGGALGVGSAAIPTVKGGVGALTKKVSERTKKLVDPDEAMKDISGLTTNEILRMEKADPQFFSKLRNYMVEDIQPGAFTSRETLAAANSKNVSLLNDQIENVYRNLDKADEALQVLPSQRNFYTDFVTKAENIVKDYAGQFPNAAAEQVRKSQALLKDLKKLANPEVDRAIKFSELRDLKNSIGKIARGNKGVGIVKDEVIDDIRYLFKNEVNRYADEVSARALAPEVQQLGQQLKNLNEKISLGITVEKGLLKRAAKDGGPGLRELSEVGIAGYFGGLPGLALSGLRSFTSSDFVRRAVAFRQVAKQKEAVNSKISGSIKSFLDPAKRATRVASNVVLLKSQLAQSEKGKAPETKQAAYENLKKNVDTLRNDPELLMERLVVAQGPLSKLSPEIAQLAAEVQTKALMYIAQNLPLGPQTVGATLFPRQYRPSEMQLAKFERILQVAEAPLTVLDDLQNGELTRDHVRALQNIYPEIYNKIRTEFAYQLPDMSDKVSYQQKLQLGILFNLPTDVALQPEMLIELQNNFGTAQQQEAADESVSAVRPTVGAMGKLDFKGRTATGVQNTIQRINSGN